MATTVLLTDPILNEEQRGSARQPLSLPGRLVWKDNRAATRFASVTIRNVSAEGAYVECDADASIPLYRLVFLQTEGPAAAADLPSPLGRGRVLAAVFRIDGASGGSAAQVGFGLRLLVEPIPSASTRSRRLRPVAANVVAMPRPIA